MNLARSAVAATLATKTATVTNTNNGQWPRAEDTPAARSHATAADTPAAARTAMDLLQTVGRKSGVSAGGSGWQAIYVSPSLWSALPPRDVSKADFRWRSPAVVGDGCLNNTVLDKLGWRVTLLREAFVRYIFHEISMYVPELRARTAQWTRQLCLLAVDTPTANSGGPSTFRTWTSSCSRAAAGRTRIQNSRSLKRAAEKFDY